MNTSHTYLKSDSYQHGIRVNVLDDTKSFEVKLCKEFTGEPQTQFKDVLSFLRLSISTRSIYKGLCRIDYHDFPLNAVQEALLNLIAHRDYGLNADSCINVYPNRIEFISQGGLPAFLSEEDIEDGRIFHRNPDVVQQLTKLRQLDTNNHGFHIIRKTYTTSEEKPSFQVAPNSFRIILPKISSPEISEAHS